MRRTAPHLLLVAVVIIAAAGWLPPLALAQGDSTPPPIISSEDDVPATGELELVDTMGNGGQPAGFPREIVVNGERFLFDRLVPIDPTSLIEVARLGDVAALATSPSAPFTAVYLFAPAAGVSELGRYLPENVGAVPVSCATDQAEFSGIEMGDTIYIAAGLEPDLGIADLQEIGQSSGQPIYADVAASQPYPELFFETAAGLQRFVISQGGIPDSLVESLALDGTVYPFAADVTDTIDRTVLEPVGCAGPYPVFISTQAGANDRFVLVGANIYQYSNDAVVPTVAPAESPQPDPTEAPTEAPATEEPTQEPTSEPTEAPTEAPVPTSEPTQEPTVEPTAEPTATPTEEPTAEPTATPTEEPTAESTSEPTEAPVIDPTASPTTEPTPAPTEEPTTEPTAAPTVPFTVPTQTPIPPVSVPTLPPNAPPPPAVTAEAANVCTGVAGALDDQGVPANLPGRVQYGGVAYTFAGTQAADEAGDLTVIGCAGAFEVAITNQADQAEVLYLRSAGTSPDSDQVYRFEAASTYDITFEITGRAQRISTGDDAFNLTDIWYTSTYSSTSVLLFVADPESTTPATIYAVNIASSPSGDAVGEYQQAEPGTTPSDDLTAQAAQAGLHPTLVINGTTYVLVTVFLPSGTTTNGFVTIFAPVAGEERDVVLGRDLRYLELFVYQVTTPAGG